VDGAVAFLFVNVLHLPRLILLRVWFHFPAILYSIISRAWRWAAGGSAFVLPPVFALFSSNVGGGGQRIVPNAWRRTALCVGTAAFSVNKRTTSRSAMNSADDAD